MASEELPIGLRLGSYELVARIGEGGMGTVYSAVHVGLGKHVAIKTLRSALAADADVRARFVREGKAAVAVRHPNVVDVDDVGVHDGVPYLVMELLDGESLQAVLARRQRLSVQETADIVVPVLSAMAESHRAGVVHRDLKPDNIFLARGAGGLPVPKVLDFGISKLLETQSLRLTGEKTVLGTPYYMAPEQASSARDVDARSDLYAIGVILYHAVSGRVPFAGSSLAQVLGQIMHAQPVPLHEWVPEIPPAFETVVVRAMEKDPAKRYQDAPSLCRALIPFASERIVLTYRAELDSAAASGRTDPAYERTAAANTTLSSAVRTVATKQAAAAAAPHKLAPWVTIASLALVGALLTLWPSSDQRADTTVSPAQQPTDQPEGEPPAPPTAAKVSGPQAPPIAANRNGSQTPPTAANATSTQSASPPSTTARAQPASAASAASTPSASTATSPSSTTARPQPPTAASTASDSESRLNDANRPSASAVQPPTSAVALPSAANERSSGPGKKGPAKRPPLAADAQHDTDVTAPISGETKQRKSVNATKTPGAEPNPAARATSDEDIWGNRK